MKRIIAALVAAGFAASAQADMVASNGSGDELRLREKPCAIASVLAAIREEHRDKFRDGQATIGGKTIRLCWADTREGFYWILPEGAQDGIAYPVTIFINSPGV